VSTLSRFSFTQSWQNNWNTSRWRYMKITWFPSSSKPLSQICTSPFLWMDKSDVQYDAPFYKMSMLRWEQAKHCGQELPLVSSDVD
jgi:hypothetical protein